MSGRIVQANLIKKKCSSWFSFQTSRTPFEITYVSFTKTPEVNLSDAPEAFGTLNVRCAGAQANPTNVHSPRVLVIRAQGGGGHNTRIEAAVFFFRFLFFPASWSSGGSFPAHFAQCSYAPAMVSGGGAFWSALSSIDHPHLQDLADQLRRTVVFDKARLQSRRISWLSAAGANGLQHSTCPVSQLDRRTWHSTCFTWRSLLRRTRPHRRLPRPCTGSTRKLTLLTPPAIRSSHNYARHWWDSTAAQCYVVTPSHQSNSGKLLRALLHPTHPWKTYKQRPCLWWASVASQDGTTWAACVVRIFHSASRMSQSSSWNGRTSSFELAINWWLLALQKTATSVLSGFLSGSWLPASMPQWTPFSGEWPPVVGNKTTCEEPCPTAGPGNWCLRPCLGLASPQRDLARTAFAQVAPPLQRALTSLTALSNATEDVMPWVEGYRQSCTRRRAGPQRPRHERRSREGRGRERSCPDSACGIVVPTCQTRS